MATVPPPEPLTARATFPAAEAFTFTVIVALAAFAVTESFGLAALAGAAGRRATTASARAAHDMWGRQRTFIWSVRVAVHDQRCADSVDGCIGSGAVPDAAPGRYGGAAMPPSPVPTVSVVMPTYNRRAQLRSVLAPLLADPAASEVVVVVDGCDDGSLQELEAMIAEHPRLIPVWQENAGEGAARQTGVERATGEVVLLLDDDVEAEPGLVAGHARRHTGRDDLVVLGYMPPVPPDARDPDAFSVLLYAEAYEGRCASYGADPALILRHLWAGNVSLRRATVLEVGIGSDVYDERYHPDREFGLRLLGHGLTGVFDRSLRARHHYHRPLDAFVRDARSQGAGWTLVSQLHGAEAGALPADRFEAGLPAPVAALVRLGRRPRAAALLSTTLTAAVRAATTAGDMRVALACARLLRRVEQQRGAIELRRRRGA